MSSSTTSRRRPTHHATAGRPCAEGVCSRTAQRALPALAPQKNPRPRPCCSSCCRSSCRNSSWSLRAKASSDSTCDGAWAAGGAAADGPPPATKRLDFCAVRAASPPALLPNVWPVPEKACHEPPPPPPPFAGATPGSWAPPPPMLLTDCLSQDQPSLRRSPAAEAVAPMRSPSPGPPALSLEAAGAIMGAEGSSPPPPRRPPPQFLCPVGRRFSASLQASHTSSAVASTVSQMPLVAAAPARPPAMAPPIAPPMAPMGPRRAPATFEPITDVPKEPATLPTVL
mmetsp:Transcript_86930/g.251110  ORF Transcript_86930/g.251110 Transcript_86930/m.251110 type:complete len:284 (+) Transcript_86930:119-970(+)